jgi:hypothetical protein
MPRTLVPSSLAHALAAAEQPDSARAILGGLLSLEFATLRPGQQQPQLQLPLQLPLPNADFADFADLPRLAYNHRPASDTFLSLVTTSGGYEPPEVVPKK